MAFLGQYGSAFRRELRVESEDGEYVSFDESFESLIKQISKAETSITICVEECQLKEHPNEWSTLRDALLSARARGVEVAVYYNSDSKECIKSLRKVKYQGEPLIQAFGPTEDEFPMYCRVIDSLLVETNQNPGICGPGPFTRITDKFVAESIELNLRSYRRRGHYTGSRPSGS